MSARLTSPRKWRSLALAGATASLATATPVSAQTHYQQPPQTIRATLWLAQAEGGEGGEAGAVADVSPEIAYLARLSIVEGHLVAAVELYRKGMPDEAVGLSGHPEAEMMDEVRETLAAHQAQDITPAMENLSAVMANAAPIADVEAALSAAHSAIAAAAAKANPTPRQQFDALLALTRAAGHEYVESTEGGEIGDVMAFQEAHGFIEVAKGLAQMLGTSTDPVVATAATKALAALDEASTAFIGIDTLAPTVGDANVLAGAAAKIELAAYAVK